MDTAQCILHQFINKFCQRSPLMMTLKISGFVLCLITCSRMLWLEHYNNGVTPEAQLKLLHHSGESLGHQSEGFLMHLIYSEVKSIQ